ncbi:hypothetical protein AVEN_237978-1 [Araneus ventricosus]|uniref:Uncharacterized protein n=1 Tax=Araneus ventricosus TaxID=182803 RepID=A0A4Y2G4V5_ARAVE|nr:hypothetical protein AVEN_237978-1 [Araneus ventricosus]
MPNYSLKIKFVCFRKKDKLLFYRKITHMNLFLLDEISPDNPTHNKMKESKFHLQVRDISSNIQGYQERKGFTQQVKVSGKRLSIFGSEEDSTAKRNERRALGVRQLNLNLP